MHMGTQARNANKGIDVYRCIDLSLQLRHDFVTMLPNIIIIIITIIINICYIVRAKGGAILFEWPSGNYYSASRSISSGIQF